LRTYFARRGAGLGLADELAGVGAVLGARHFAARTEFKGLARWIAGPRQRAGLGYLLLRNAGVLGVDVSAVCGGFSATVQMAATNTIIQSRVPDELRGESWRYTRRCQWRAADRIADRGGVAKRIGAPNTLAVLDFWYWRGVCIFLFRVVMRLRRPVEARLHTRTNQAGLGR